MHIISRKVLREFTKQHHGSETELTQTWHKLQAIYTENEYNQAVGTINRLLDIIQEDENHPLCGLLDMLSVLVQDYEEEHYPTPDVTGVDVLKYLMDEHDLTLSSFPEIGNEFTISNLLAGKQELSVDNIRFLSKQFGLSPATFL
jgi:HTH-type transcriptional regulator/antitoxin HigA